MRLLALISIAATFIPYGVYAAPVFKTVDANGRTIYSDKAPATGLTKVLRLPDYQPLPAVLSRMDNVSAAQVSGEKPVGLTSKIAMATGAFEPADGPFRPSKSKQIDLYVMPGAQPYLDVIQRAAREWGAACGLALDYVDKQEPVAAPLSGNNVIVVDYGPGSNHGTSATAFRTYEGNAVGYTKIIISRTYGKADMRFVTLHELGHAIGLPHATDPAALMHANNGNRSYYTQTGEAPVLTSTDINGCSKLRSV